MTPKHYLHDLPVLILGLGTSGLAMARWCVRQGARVTVADSRAEPPQLAALRQGLAGVDFVCGPLGPLLLQDGAVRAVYRSPGLSPADVAELLVAAQALGVPVGGELDLFAQALADLATPGLLRTQTDAAPMAEAEAEVEVEVDADAAPQDVPVPVPTPADSGYRPALLAVTGTNGKTTVTALTGQLVARAGKSVALAGNIGPSLLDTLGAHLDANTLPQVWVLELSSFQLESATGFEATAAALLNLSQDHLDWHGSMAAYAAAKARIFGAHALLLLNRDDPAVLALLPAPRKVKLQRPLQRPHLLFGSDLPQRPGDFGLEQVGGTLWLVRALESDAPRKRRVADEPLHIQRLLPVDALQIRGRHNALNALAALALASAAGCSLAPMLYALRDYRGEPHRLVLVEQLHGVAYFDDSKGTNVGASVAALQGLGEAHRVLLILGGEGKGQDFTPLVAPVARYARAVFLMGRDAALIRATLADCGVPLVDVPSLEEAVQQAAQRAHAGDAVLLSPACASFDMFDGYAHRGQVFCAAVAAQAGSAPDAGMALEGVV